jgi:hypothetical protein
VEQATPWYLIIGIAIGFGMWAAGIAGTKQRSMVGFGALGLLFGLVGVLIAYAVSAPEPARGVYVPFGHPPRA